MNPDKYETADTNSHAFQARIALQQAEGNIHPTVPDITDPERVQAALTQATLALVEETRTATLMAYLATLPAWERHEGAAVLDLVKSRLGLDASTSSTRPTRPVVPGDPALPQ